jgi:hypothetical protein
MHNNDYLQLPQGMTAGMQDPISSTQALPEEDPPNMTRDKRHLSAQSPEQRMTPQQISRTSVPNTCPPLTPQPDTHPAPALMQVCKTSTCGEEKNTTAKSLAKNSEMPRKMSPKIDKNVPKKKIKKQNIVKNKKEQEVKFEENQKSLEKEKTVEKLEKMSWKNEKRKMWSELEKDKNGKMKVTKYVENGLACTSRRRKPRKNMKKMEEKSNQKSEKKVENLTKIVTPTDKIMAPGTMDTTKNV